MIGFLGGNGGHSSGVETSDFGKCFVCSAYEYAPRSMECVFVCISETVCMSRP